MYIYINTTQDLISVANRRCIVFNKLYAVSQNVFVEIVSVFVYVHERRFYE